jgi:hypothetical protein
MKKKDWHSVKETPPPHPNGLLLFDAKTKHYCIGYFDEIYRNLPFQFTPTHWLIIVLP